MNDINQIIINPATKSIFSKKGAKALVQEVSTNAIDKFNQMHKMAMQKKEYVKKELEIRAKEDSL